MAAEQGEIVAADQFGPLSEGLCLPEPEGDALSEGGVGVKACVTDQDVSLNGGPTVQSKRTAAVGQAAHYQYVGDRRTHRSPGLHTRHDGHHFVESDAVAERQTARIGFRECTGQAEGAVVLGHGQEDAVRRKCTVGKCGARKLSAWN